MHPFNYLFVPATRTERIAKAFAAGAHAVIVDLEDAVDPADKAAARAQLAGWLASAPTDRKIWLRCNAVATAWFADDLALLRAHAPVLAGVMLSKTESGADLDRLAGTTPVLPVLALIESARGVLALDEICRHPQLARLAFGSADLARDLDCEDAADILAPARLQLVLHSAAHGLPPPVDGVTFALDAPQRAEHDAAQAARMGFGAKLCVHPSQLMPVLRGFAPGEAQCRWAAGVIAAADADAGTSAQRLNGEMIDRPVIERARRILQRRDALGGAAEGGTGL